MHIEGLVFDAWLSGGSWPRLQRSISADTDKVEGTWLTAQDTSHAQGGSWPRLQLSISADTDEFEGMWLTAQDTSHAQQLQVELSGSRWLACPKGRLWLNSWASLAFRASLEARLIDDKTLLVCVGIALELDSYI